MFKKYAIEYVTFPHRDNRRFTHWTDDPVEAEDFLMHLLASRAHIIEIRHNGVAVTRHQFDKMVKIAAERIVSAMLSESLGLDMEAVKDKFGFAA